jgi:hypothetical protein
MDSEKAWYWIAAGVLALGLSNSLAERQIGLIQALPDRFQEAADQFTADVSDQAMRVLDIAGRLSNRNELGMAGAEVALARVQTQVACLRTVVAERQAAAAQVAEERARVRSLGELPTVRKFSCPKSPATPTVTVHQMPGPDTI